MKCKHLSLEATSLGYIWYCEKNKTEEENDMIQKKIKEYSPDLSFKSEFCPTVFRASAEFYCPFYEKKKFEEI